MSDKIGDSHTDKPPIGSLAPPSGAQLTWQECIDEENKPATGEWTEIVNRADKELEDTVSNFLVGLGYESGKVKEIILRAINAALADERERVTREIFDKYCDDPTEGAMRAKEKEIQQLTGQVALMTVERNEARNAHKLIAQKRGIIEGLRKELAAVKEAKDWPT